MSRLTRFALLPLLAAACVLTLGTADTQSRFNDLGHKLMCMCGCDQILLECDHVGCPDASKESQELIAAIGKGESDTAVMETFQAEYGPTVLAAPWLTRFNIVAWVVPPALLLLGLLGTFAPGPQMAAAHGNHARGFGRSGIQGSARTHPEGD